MADRERDSDFSIVIATFGASYMVDLQFADRADTGEGQMCDLPPAMDDLRPLLTAVGSRGWRHGSHGISTADIAYLAPDLAVVQEIGKRLFGAVLQEEGAGAFRARLVSALQAPQGHMRVRIDATKNDPTLFRIPWEALYDPKEGRWLGTDVATPLHRVLRSNKTSKRPARVKAPLKVLIVVANPENDLDAEAELANLDARVKVVEQASKEKVLLVLPPIRRATRSELYRRILDDRPNIIHYIGHGSFRDGVGYIHLHDRDDEAKAEHLSAADFSELLSNDLPNLVILNTCQGGTASDFDPFGGTAQSLIRQGVPAVVAMQFQISDKAAITFSEALYRSLLNKDPIDIAVTRARHAILTGDRDIQPEMITPVLYCASNTDGLLLIEDVAIGFGAEPAPAPSGSPEKRRSANVLLLAGGVVAILLVGSVLSLGSPPPSGSLRHPPDLILDPSRTDDPPVDSRPAMPQEDGPVRRQNPTGVADPPPGFAIPETAMPTQPVGVDPLEWAAFERAQAEWRAEVARLETARQQWEADVAAASAERTEYERAHSAWEEEVRRAHASPGWRERLGDVCRSFGFCRRYPADTGAGGPAVPSGGPSYSSGVGSNSGANYGGVLPGSEQDFVVNVGDRIYFDLNSVTVPPDAYPRLDAQAEWLRRYPNIIIRIEGNTDERGSREHNMVLGARRAESVRDYLIERGVAENRIQTTSFGKERPILAGSDEDAWARNRNVHTSLVSGVGEQAADNGRATYTPPPRLILIEFELGTDSPSSEAAETLVVVAEAFALPENLNLSALVVVFDEADTLPSEVASLAAARAQAVRASLTAGGLTQDRIVIEPHATIRPNQNGIAGGVSIQPVITGAHEVLFEADQVLPEEYAKLDLAVSWLSGHPDDGLDIYSPALVNEDARASGQRAQAVVDALEARGIGSDQLSLRTASDGGLTASETGGGQTRVILIIRSNAPG